MRLAVLLFLFTLSAQAADIEPTALGDRACTLGYDRLVQRIKGRPQLLVEPERVEPAILAVFNDRARDGIPAFSNLGGVPPPDEFQRRWRGRVASLPSASYGSAEDPIRTEPIVAPGTKGPSTAKRVFLKIGERIFRPASKDRALRPRFAAALLGEALEMDGVPPMRWAFVNEEFGLLAGVAPGEPVKSIVEFKALLRSGKIREDSAADAEAFAFLIGDSDAHGMNFNVDLVGRVHSFDHGGAFYRRLVPITAMDLSDNLYGPTLPLRYSDAWIKKLKALTPAQIKVLLGKHLSNDEMKGVLFRREIILKDVELRGKDALISSPH